MAEFKSEFDAHFIQLYDLLMCLKAHPAEIRGHITDYGIKVSVFFPKHLMKISIPSITFVKVYALNRLHIKHIYGYNIKLSHRLLSFFKIFFISKRIFRPTPRRRSKINNFLPQNVVFLLNLLKFECCSRAIIELVRFFDKLIIYMLFKPCLAAMSKFRLCYFC